MKELKVSDKAGKIRRAADDVVREALAGFVPGGRTTHRIGGHTDWYHGAAVSPDGSRLITANRDGTARLWDCASAQCLMVFRGHTGEVVRAAFMNHTDRAVTTDDNGTLRLWDCATGACVLVLKGHHGRVAGLAVSPDDRYIASSDSFWALRVWSLPEGTCEHSAAGINNVMRILVTRDGNTLLTLDSRHDILRWNFPGIGDPSLVASGDYWDIALAGYEEFVAAGRDGLSCFDVRTGARKRFYSLEPHKPYKVTTTSDETRFVACCRPGETVLVLDRGTGMIEKQFTGPRFVTDMTLSPDGKTLYTVGFDRTCNMWDIGTGECLQAIGSTRSVHDLSLSGDGMYLAACDKGDTVKLWNLADGSQRAKFRGATSVAFLERARLVATGHDDGRVRFWDVESGNEKPGAVLHAYSSPVACVLPLESGASFATFARHGMPKLWNTEKRNCLKIHNTAGNIDIHTVTIDEDTQRIAMRRQGKNHILVCDLRSGDILATLTDHARRYGNLSVIITGIRFLPRGRGLVSCGRDGLIILWDLSTFKAARSINAGSSIVSMAVENDGRHVVIGTHKGGVERWDLESGQREICWPPQGSPVEGLALSSDENRLFASFSDGTVRIVDRESTALVCSLWNVNDGFFWFTPPDGHAPDGWVWTDREDLLHLIEEGSEGKVLGAVPLNDDRRRVYVHTRNNAAMVQARLKGLDEYGRVAGRYARALAGKHEETTARPRPMLTAEDKDA